MVDPLKTIRAGLITGAVAGLATITPASGSVLPLARRHHRRHRRRDLLCACTWVKGRLGYDDLLDVFACTASVRRRHDPDRGVAVAALSVSPDSPEGSSGLLEGNARQVLIQLYAVIAVLIWSGALTFILLKAIEFFLPLRVSEQHEIEGLDLTQHGEALQ
jgi:Amt family ammonium transporter